MILDTRPGDQNIDRDAESGGEAIKGMERHSPIALLDPLYCRAVYTAPEPKGIVGEALLFSFFSECFSDHGPFIGHLSGCVNK